MNNKSKVGWVIDARWPYRNIMASTRIRCLDIISFLKTSGIKTGLYKPYKKYSSLVFQKTFSGKHYEIAEKLSARGCRILLDVNVNYFEKKGETTQVTQEQINNIHRFLDLTDTVLVSSPYLRDIAEKYHSDVHYIPEHISTIGNYTPKTLSGPVKLVYCGYAVKADCVLLIQDVLKELSKDHDMELIFVTDTPPTINLPLKTSFIKYRQEHLPSILRQGDIKIAPRNLENSYDLGHSFTKIGYPMSVGLPVIASPVPSYMNSPALIASTKEEWLRHLRLLMENPEEYKKLSQAGTTFVRENFSIEKIGNMYLDLFKGTANA